MALTVNSGIRRPICTLNNRPHRLSLAIMTGDFVSKLRCVFLDGLASFLGANVETIGWLPVIR